MVLAAGCGGDTAPPGAGEGDGDSAGSTIATLEFHPPATPREADAAREAARRALAGSREAVYVGDAACAECHAEIAASYAATNKSRSLIPFDAATAPERFQEGTTVYHEEDDLYYQVFLRNDSLIQREYRLDAQGRTLHRLERAAHRVVGSGNATRSYFYEENGYLTEMPLTWYVEAARWDMSPGYREANDRFDRQINLACLTCHAQVPEPSPFTQNHYRSTPDAIGCERCHGPGSVHVEARREGDPTPGEPDATVVNPAHLNRDQQLSVCQQCHLAGVTVFQPGHDPTTFRPGMSLAMNRTVFVPGGWLTDPEWVGIDSHPLRLSRSACYQASEMTCSSCHDAHRSAEELGEEYYNGRCVSCHTGEAGKVAHSCARPEAAAGLPGGEDAGDCVSCHMARGGTTDVPHVSFTDHWIRRRPGPALDPDLGRSAFEGPELLALVALQDLGRSAHVLKPRTPTRPEHDLESAAAYWEFFETMHRHRGYVPEVIRRARRGLADGATHVEGQIALARALAGQDSVARAYAVIQDVVRMAPDHAWARLWEGAFLESLGRPAEAVDPLRHALRIQPRFSEARLKLADVLYASGEREEAARLLEETAQADPVHAARAWYKAGIIWLELGVDDRAEPAFARASSMDPDLVDAHLQYGTLRMAAGDLNEALRLFTSAVTADPASVGAHGSLALLYLQAGDGARARSELQTVLRLDPDNAQARALLQRIR